ncbi:MAG: glycosyltransferase family 25 protein [Gammaproteobacteria bacterium]|nr:glycosyltransferase family 25 protein [Gammaproteobacteria bacterium]
MPRDPADTARAAGGDGARTAGFPTVFVINLERSTARRADIAARLGALGVPFRFFTAVDGSGLDPEQVQEYDGARRRRQFGRDLTRGEIGCLLSHRGVYARIVAENIERAIVLEDDVHFAQDFPAVVDALCALPLDWDLIRFLDNPKLARKSRRLATLGRYGLIRPATASGGAYAYLLTRHAAEVLLALTARTALPIDALHSQVWRTGLETYAVTPSPIVADDVVASTIGEARFDKQVALSSWRRALYPLTRFACKLDEGFGKRASYAASRARDEAAARRLAAVPPPAGLLPAAAAPASTIEAPQLAGKSLTFCLTTARSGTAFLASLLALADDADALHEPAPDFHHALADVRSRPEAALEFVRDRKLPKILACPHRHYVETSHLFAEGFYEAFVALGIPFQLIVLNREPRRVAESNWRVEAIPGRTKDGLGFLLDPRQDGVMKLPRWERMSDYQLCYWYSLEMERRKARYAAERVQAGGVVVETSLEELKDWTRFRAFCARLGLQVAEEKRETHARICAVKVNPKSKHRRKWTLVPLARQERAVWRALGSAAGDLGATIVARYGPAATHGAE